MTLVGRTIESLQEAVALMEEIRDTLYRLPADEWLKTLGGEIGMWSGAFREGLDWLRKCESAIELSLDKEMPK